jgi:HK97 family phage major capsid protein
MNAHVPVPQSDFAQFLAKLMRGASTGYYDEGLIKAVAATGLSEGGGSAGGFLLPDNVAADVWTRVYAMGRIISLCDRQPITRGSGIKIPGIDEASRTDGSRFGGIQLVWTGEGGLAASGKPKLNSIDMELKKLLGLVYATDELVQDAPALAAFLRRALAMEAQFKIEDAIINGQGGAKPLGVLNSGALIVVAKDSGQLAGTVSASNLYAMAARLWGPSHGKAIWLMSNEVFEKVSDLEDADGVVLFETGPNGERLLLQMPVELCEYTAPLSSAGDIVLATSANTSWRSVSRASTKASTSSSRPTRPRSASASVPMASLAGVADRAEEFAVTQSPFVALGAR